MLDSKALASIPLVPANTAPPAPDYPWPKPFTSAMFLSFDVDAESAWTSKDAGHAQRLITMSYGGYEARVGTPKLLELLDQLDLKATFLGAGCASRRSAIAHLMANSPRSYVWRWCATASSIPRLFATMCGLTAIGLR